MASSQSHRQTVAPEISATRPRSTTSRAISSALQRLKGTPLLAGSSQAMAFTSTLTEGGKGRGPARAGPIFQSGQTFLVKALAPLRDRLGCGVQPLGYLLVGDFLGGQEDDPGAHHLPVRGGVGALVRRGRHAAFRWARCGTGSGWASLPPFRRHGICRE